MPVNLFDAVSTGLAQALTFHRQRHEILAANIANIETPGYRARDLEFDEALQAAFDGQDTSAVAERVVDRPTSVGRPDGNTVDLDMEMARLADNRGAFTTMAEILSRRLAGLRRAIEEVR